MGGDADDLTPLQRLVRIGAIAVALGLLLCAILLASQNFERLVQGTIDHRLAHAGR